MSATTSFSQSRNGFQRVPDLILLINGVHGAVEVQLAVALFSAALHVQRFRGLNGVVVFLAQSRRALLVKHTHMHSPSFLGWCKRRYP